MENNLRDEEDFSFMQTWIQGLVAGKAKKVGWCRGGQTRCVVGKKKSKAILPHSKVFLFLIFRAGPSFLFLYPAGQDTCVWMMLINISIGPGLSKPWVFGMLSRGPCEKCSGADTLGGALQPSQEEPSLTRQSLTEVCPLLNLKWVAFLLSKGITMTCFSESLITLILTI